MANTNSVHATSVEQRNEELRRLEREGMRRETPSENLNHQTVDDAERIDSKKPKRGRERKDAKRNIKWKLNRIDRQQAGTEKNILTSKSNGRLLSRKREVGEIGKKGEREKQICDGSYRQNGHYSG